MREIKFRAWNGKEMITPALVFDDTTNPFMVTDQAIIPEINLKWMQFTGLKDANGKDIWECDILGYELLSGMRPGWVV